MSSIAAIYARTTLSQEDVTVIGHPPFNSINVFRITIIVAAQNKIRVIIKSNIGYWLNIIINK